MRIWLPCVRVGSGADVFTERLAEGLERQGHRPLLQWFPRHYEFVPWRLRAASAPVGADVAHASSWHAFAFRRLGLPLVVTEHHFVADPAFAPFRSPAQALYHRGFVGPCMRLSFRAADVVVAVSDHTARALETWLGRRPRVIYNWVDGSRFVPADPAPPREGRPFRLLFVGNPARRKGSDLLPGLAERLGPGVELRCLGGLRRGYEGTGPANLRPLAGVPVTEMPRLYQEVDAVLVPTRYEAFGYVALEAMACGLPVVGFDSTGTREVCRNGETALLVATNDVAALAEACRRLAADPELCRRLGAAGRQRALAVFGEADGVAAYVRAYRDAIARARCR